MNRSRATKSKRVIVFSTFLASRGCRITCELRTNRKRPGFDTCRSFRRIDKQILNFGGIIERALANVFDQTKQVAIWVHDQKLSLAEFNRVGSIPRLLRLLE